MQTGTLYEAHLVAVMRSNSSRYYMRNQGRNWVLSHGQSGGRRSLRDRSVGKLVGDMLYGHSSGP